MRKYFSRIAVGLLVVAALFLLYVDIRQAQVLDVQRHMIIDMYQFIVAGCPVSQLQ
jgi:hypothetical protein